jgi:hypothetical protein
VLLIAAVAAVNSDCCFAQRAAGYVLVYTVMHDDSDLGMLPLCTASKHRASNSQGQTSVVQSALTIIAESLLTRANCSLLCLPFAVRCSVIQMQRSTHADP